MVHLAGVPNSDADLPERLEDGGIIVAPAVR
jgi:hypothetical protein